MPLLDPFRPPLSGRVPWTTIHAAWSSRIADELNEYWLPSGFVACELSTSADHPEIDIAPYEDRSASVPLGNGSRGGTVVAPDWTVPAPAVAVPVAYPRGFEVQVRTRD